MESPSPAFYGLTMRLFDMLGSRKRSDDSAGNDGTAASGATVFVTSARRGEGRTFVARAIAAHLAELSNEKILLVDTDVEHASLHTVFGIGNTEGFTDCLASDDPAKARPQQTHLPNLDVMTIGKTRKPGLIFKPDPFRKFVRHYCDRYGMVVLDGGLLEASGCLPHQSDGTILVVDSSSTRREVIQGVMARSNVDAHRYLGAVLNKRIHYIPRFIYRRF